MDTNATPTPTVDHHAPISRRGRRYRGVSRHDFGLLPDARELFVSRVAIQNRQIQALPKLTPAQSNALGAISGTIHTPRITDATFAKLETLGLVRVDLDRPHRGSLTDLGMAYLRRGKAGAR